MASKMKILRKALGLTQDDMAKQLHISKIQYSRIERGESNGSTPVLENIAGILGTTIDDLRGNHTFSNEKKIIELMKSFSKPQQDWIIRMLEDLSDVLNEEE